MKKRALISVYDKTNIVEFCKKLIELNFEIISTGGTKKLLDQNNIKNISVEDVTNFPEMLDGRVKTLHPKIHGGILGVLDNEAHVEKMNQFEITPISLVCVNLYPFKKTIEKKDCTFLEAIENIDIGGPAMLRSAAKNHKYTTVICDIDDYDLVIDEIKNLNNTTFETRKKLAAKVFKVTSEYDNLISDYLFNNESLNIKYNLKQNLRYGENPHQSASFYVDENEYSYSISNSIQLHGKELSYNNIQDSNATLEILREFEYTNCVVACKHTNPCGVGIGDTIHEAWNKAYEADPKSIFGGIVAFNKEVDEPSAKIMSEMFLEVILAPSFSKEAFELLSKKKNIRLITFNKHGNYINKKLVSVTGGILVQSIDDTSDNEIQIVTNKKPTEKEIDDALFGMKIVKHVKSNAIVLVKDGQSIGIGAGQMNRVGACKIACEMADMKSHGSVLASDAFFPMSDTVELAAKYGISCIIQPGGSIRDQESIDMCNKYNIAMIFTGKRHFKH